MKSVFQLSVTAILFMFQAACASNTEKVGGITDDIGTGIIFVNQGVQYERLSNVELINDPQANTATSGVFLQPMDDSDSQPVIMQSEHKEQDNEQDVVGTIGHLLLVKKHHTVRSSPSSMKDKSVTEWYVRNLTDKSVGIINGELFITLVDVHQADDIATEYGFIHRVLLPDTATALMEADVGDDFLNRIKQLREDSRVENVDIRIVTELPATNQR